MIWAIRTYTEREWKRRTPLEFSCTKALPDNSGAWVVAMNAEHLRVPPFFPGVVCKYSLTHSSLLSIPCKHLLCPTCWTSHLRVPKWHTRELYPQTLALTLYSKLIWKQYNCFRQEIVSRGRVFQLGFLKQCGHKSGVHTLHTQGAQLGDTHSIVPWCA